MPDGTTCLQWITPVELIAGVLNVEPPSIVRINPALTDRHAVVCSQLLAKSPADRFQSAAEALGALRLLSSSNGSTSAGGQPLGRRISRRSVMAAAGLLTLSLAVGYWATREVRLPSGPREAEGWYRRGTEQIREGAYQSARRALEQAVAIFPQHALAFSRLAEANAELDDQNAAREDLLRVTALVTDESRLAADDRMRLTAVRSLVLRDMDSAIAAYRELATRHPDDAGAWLDLGRAQDAAGLRNDARDSYLRAIARNKQYAPAYLRLAFEEAVASRFGEAEEALNQAEQLYVAASEIEGRAEVLLRRGSMLDSKGESKAARSALEQSLALSKSASAPFQQIRIRLALSCVIASEGRLKDSEVVASEAVQQAIDSGLQTVAAEGLVDLSATLLEAGRLDEAESQARRAVTLAEQRQARRTSARARVQLASVLQERGRAAETLAMLDSTLPFLLAGKYRRLELLALSIQSRAQQQLDRLDLARQVSGQILEVAELVKDEGQIAIAASNLASVMESLGQYPAALALRERAEQIHRRAEDRLVLPVRHHQSSRGSHPSRAVQGSGDRVVGGRRGHSGTC